MATHELNFKSLSKPSILMVASNYASNARLYKRQENEVKFYDINNKVIGIMKKNNNGNVIYQEI